ncbi:unnamed protein product [Psylliodes chrysocephalus]|uniref:Uncharacterized protein n=1 Tax=Psylliodes chrysocephalus TaxID=3402493 RepID=A0A9P0CBA9_9CUCU|nr:unnamed protein product [Psylliodes chrysocephala]
MSTCQSRRYDLKILILPFQNCQCKMDLDEQPFWINFRADSFSSTSEDLEQKEKNDTTKAYYLKTLKNIINQINKLLQKAYKIEETLINAVFKMDSETINESLKEYQYGWLPSKDSLLSNIGNGELKENKIEEILPNVYTNLQTVSAGLELMLEHEKYNEFERLKSYLRSVLCEIYTALRECQLNLPEDVSRSVVPQEIRNMIEIPETNIRNWIIFRNFIDTLNGVTDIFLRFLSNISDE